MEQIFFLFLMHFHCHWNLLLIIASQSTNRLNTHCTPLLCTPFNSNYIQQLLCLLIFKWKETTFKYSLPWKEMQVVIIPVEILLWFFTKSKSTRLQDLSSPVFQQIKKKCNMLPSFPSFKQCQVDIAMICGMQASVF